MVLAQRIALQIRSVPGRCASRATIKRTPRAELATYDPINQVPAK